MLCHTRPQEGAPGLVRKEQGGESRAQDLYCFCPGKDKAGLGNSLELTSLSNVGSRAQGWSLVVWYLALGDGRKKNIGLMCENWVKKGRGGHEVGIGWRVSNMVFMHL